MSQMNGMAPDGGGASASSSYGTGAKPSNTGRAVLLLAIAVILGVALLHELDNGSSTTALASKPAAKQSAQAAVTPSSTTTVPLRTPADIKVLVANGVGVAGAAT